jgi:ubiquinone/menaquinone biosynthesis C-methylase UbiE
MKREVVTTSEKRTHTWASGRMPQTAMFRSILFLLASNSAIVRAIRRPVWRFFYTTSAKLIPEEFLVFMNLGFLDGADEEGDDSVRIADHLAARLYQATLAGVGLENRTVLEVGCGHGGGAAYLAGRYGPRMLIGVDLNRRHVALCRDKQKAPNLQFRRGDAEALPVDASSTDVVINIESSHCYPSRRRFIAEVARVLRPGGTFLLADIFILDGKSDTPEQVSSLLADEGFAIAECLEITGNVLEARDAVSRSTAFRSRVQERVPRVVVPVFEEAFFLSDTRNHVAMSEGHVQYWRWRATTPVRMSTQVAE